MNSTQVMQGIGVSTGIVIGSAFYYQPTQLKAPKRPRESAETELQRFYQARERCQLQLETLRKRIEDRANTDSAQIFRSHSALVFDPALETAVRRKIELGATVETAVQQAADELVFILQGADSDFVNSRAADMRDVGQRLQRILLDVPDTAFAALDSPVIVIAEDLTPSDTASLDPTYTKGLCLAGGGQTSHVAILARTLAIPAVVGLGQNNIQMLKDSHTLILDGLKGQVIANPTPETLTHYSQAQQRQKAQAAHAKSFAQQPGHTANGRLVPVMANISDLTSAQKAAELGAEGVGLLRTEFIYLHEKHPPSEQRQYETYRAIFEAMGDCPVIVRTLDVGGDKPPQFIDFPAEANPFLGWRGIRVSLERPDLFKTQLRAILRAAVGKNVALMYPMIESVETLRSANQLLQAVCEELDSARLPYAHDVPVGVMIETPAAALLVDLLQAECDFFSIGSNDLTQYTLACDRNNEHVSAYFEAFNPAVLRLIKQTIDAAHAAGKTVSLCGEFAAVREAAPILLGLGLDKFSVTPAAISEVKATLRQFTDSQAAQIAQHALTLPTAAAIRANMESVFSAHEIQQTPAR